MQLVLLASYEQGLQDALDRFSAAFDQPGMKISTKNINSFMSLQKPKPVRSIHSSSGEIQVICGDIHEWRNAEQADWYTYM